MLCFNGKVWGVLEGLKLVRKLGFRKVELHIDSIAVVQVVKERRLKSSLDVALAKQIWTLLDSEWCVEIAHSYREANKCADALTNLWSSLKREIIVFDDCPSQLKDIYQANRIEITTPE
jgi:ribonuclease HI